MIPSLRVDPRDAVPIWKQIEHGVREIVAAGMLRPGDLVPSVRDLSRQLRVNPATVAKAYQRLADLGVLAVRRGDGTFVAEAQPVLPIEERRHALREGARRYAGLAAIVGASAEEARVELEISLDALVPPAERSTVP